MNVYTFLDNINAKFFITLTTKKKKKPKYSVVLLTNIKTTFYIPS